MKTQYSNQDWGSITLADIEAAAKIEQELEVKHQEWLKSHPDRAEMDAAAENDD